MCLSRAACLCSTEVGVVQKAQRLVDALAVELRAHDELLPSADLSAEAHANASLGAERRARRDLLEEVDRLIQEVFAFRQVLVELLCKSNPTRNQYRAVESTSTVQLESKKTVNI